MSGLLFTLLIMCSSSVDGFPRELYQMEISGIWENVNSEDLGIIRIEISKQEGNVKVFSKCHPRDCEWGTQKIVKKGKVFEAIYKNRAAERTLGMRLLDGTTMELKETIIYQTKKKKVITYTLIKTR